MKRIILLIFIALIIAGTVFRIVANRGKSSQQSEKTTFIPVKVESPKYGDIEETISFVGDIKGEDQAMIYPEANGQLIEYKVKEGDRIQKDTVIAIIDRAQTGMDFEPLKVKSPISGIVGRLYLDKGTNVYAQTAVALIAEMDRVKVELNIPERYLTEIKVGQVCQVKVDAYPKTVFTGEIVRISPVLNLQDRTFYVETVMDNPEHLLRPGMFAEIFIILRSRKGILVPKEAVIRDINTEKDFVFLFKNKIAVKKEVKLGITKDDVAEILSGISLKDKIIVVGHEFLQGSEKVEVVE